MKKILILSCESGGGHISATKAIQQNLIHDYYVMEVEFFDVVLNSIDPLPYITRNKYKSEDVYNYCLQKKWTFLPNVLYYNSLLYFFIFKKVIKRLIRKYLDHTKPDLIISDIPIINELVHCVCQERSIPFLIVPTDLNPRTFIREIKLTDNNLLITLAFDDPLIKQEFDRFRIPQEKLKLTGFPLRQQFFEEKNINLIKDHYQISNEKKVVLILMGAAGSKASLLYVKELLTNPLPLHLIVCLGKNERIRKDLMKLKLPHLISMTILGPIENISDLMAISDICITKCGTVSVCEAIYMNLPMLLDNTSTPLKWEKFNLKFVKSHNFGFVVNRYSQVNSLVISLLSDKLLYESLKNSLESYHKEFFGTHIKQLVKSLLKI